MARLAKDRRRLVQKVSWSTLGHDGRSPLYRWGDLLEVELKMRNSPKSRRIQQAA